MVRDLFAGSRQARIKRAFHFKIPADFGQKLPPEKFWIAQMVVRGRSVHDLEGKRIISKAGDFLLIRPETAQTYRHSAGTSGLILIFEMPGPVKWPNAAPAAFSLANAWALVPHFKDLIHEFHRVKNKWSSERLTSRLALFLSEWLLLAEPSRRGQLTLNSVQSETLYSHVAEHIESKLSSHELAKALRLSRDYFCRVFANTFGMPPRRFIVQEKMLHASELLRSGELGVSEVAERLGYASLASFSRLYKQICGENPSNLKNKGT